MNIKVGDIVEYKGEIVRILRIIDGEFTLSGIGTVRCDHSDIKLITSVKPPKLTNGDLVRIHDIPESEKDFYGVSWISDMDEYVNRVLKVYDFSPSQEVGDSVYIHGWQFQTYHLEPINDYDII